MTETQPEKAEFEHVTAIISRIAGAHGGKIPADLSPANTAVAILTFERPFRNLLLQWTLDESGTVDDLLFALARFVAVSRWIIETTEKHEYPKRDELTEIIPLAYLDAMSAAMADEPALRKSITAGITSFIEFGKKQEWDK